MVSRGERILSYVLLLAFAVFAVYPFISTTLVAFNPPDVSVRGLAIPQTWSLDSFTTAWNDPDASIGRSLLNSTVLAVVVVAASVFLSDPDRLRLRDDALPVLERALLRLPHRPRHARTRPPSSRSTTSSGPCGSSTPTGP